MPADGSTQALVARRVQGVRKRADGGTEYFHAFLGATIVAPGHQQVLPLPPEFIAPRDGAEKQDCERTAAKRWLAKHGREAVHLKPVFLGDDTTDESGFAVVQPRGGIAIKVGGGPSLATHRLESTRAVFEWLVDARNLFAATPRQPAATNVDRNT